MILSHLASDSTTSETCRPGKDQKKIGRKRCHRLFQSEIRHAAKRREACSWRNPSSYEAIRRDGAPLNHSLALRYNRAGRLSVSSSRETKSRVGSALVCVWTFATCCESVLQQRNAAARIKNGPSQRNLHWLPIDVLSTYVRGTYEQSCSNGRCGGWDYFCKYRTVMPGDTWPPQTTNGALLDR